MKPWLHHTVSGFSLTLHVQPGAKQTGVCGEHGAALKIRLAAPPVDGRANQALIAWLASQFGIPQRDVFLLHGEKSRQKVLAFKLAMAEEEILHKLGMARD